jgi:TRAP-type transport system small permease protein
MLKILSRFNQTLEKIIYWMTAGSTIIFISFVLLSVITRYLTKAPILSSIEISRLFFVWACFLAATLAYRRNAHIAISFIVDMFSKKWIKVVDVVLLLLTITFFITILYQSLQVVRLLWFTHLPVSGISQSWFYVPVPFISVVIIFFALEKIIEDFQRPVIAAEPHIESAQ